ncbi:MAG: hypothetical protein H6737_31010 [Alphaproteobacteria bacterium]|nr:hypothetical protein [Alphaproteobacteria bacterium]
MTRPLARMAPEAVRAAPGSVLRALDTAAAVVLPGWWAPERAREAAAAVQAARDAWVPDFDGKQFCLGRAWYAHLETGRAGAYFASAEAGNSAVESALPGLQAHLREALAGFVDASVHQRPRWGGAGVHVFPAGGVCATDGGCVHFDHEGLTPGQRASRPAALSLVLCLQPPESGGGLWLWDVELGEPERAVGEPVEHVSRAGDLVVFSSYRLHQIQPFAGAVPRISATLHGAATPLGWESWF